MANLSGISNETLIGKMLRAPLRLIPRTMVLPILQGALRGKKWTAGSATHGCWLGSYEYHKQRALQRELKAGQVVYDIGANVGFYSLLASVLVGETGHVYSFEPFPDNLRELRRHLELNQVANCTVMDAAVSSLDGEAPFDPSEDRCMGHLSANGILRVRTLTLDRLIQEQGMRPPNLMKIDIEGAEYECLRGAAGVIQEFAPVIFLATHGREAHTSCLDLLTKWRYRFESLDARPLDATDELIARPARPV
jgi:FkbM family methyltransferase